MRIALNAQLLATSRFGIENYIYNLVKAFSQEDKNNTFDVFSSIKHDDLESENVRIIKTSVPFYNYFSRILWEQAVMPFKISGYDVFHNPDHMLPMMPINTKKVITVHDLAFYKHPETFSARKRIFKQAMTPGSIRKADAIIAVSKNTKRDIVDLFKVDPDKIHVVYNGLNEEFSPANEDKLRIYKKAKRLEKPYILFVGTIEPRKGIQDLIKAFDMLSEGSNKDLELIIAGRNGWLSGHIHEIAKASAKKDRIRFIGKVDAQELPLLYSGAEVFVYPSIYEGFGFPPLEAMACGTPVITTDSSSLPEVVGSAALSVPPKQPTALAYAISRVLSDTELRAALVDSGIEQAAKFSWSKCAAQTAKVYKSLNEKNKS